MPVHFFDAKSDQCRFPLWADDVTVGDVCGDPVKAGSTYCPACHAKAHDGCPTPSMPRGERASAPRDDREPDLVEVFA